MLSLQINPIVELFLLQACMSLFTTPVEYFVYSHLPYFLYITAIICCSDDEEFLSRPLMKPSSRRASPRSAACGVSSTV
jgi:hypothetical protein